MEVEAKAPEHQRPSSTSDELSLLPPIANKTPTTDFCLSTSGQEVPIFRQVNNINSLHLVKSALRFQDPHFLVCVLRVVVVALYMLVVVLLGERNMTPIALQHYRNQNRRVRMMELRLLLLRRIEIDPEYYKRGEDRNPLLIGSGVGVRVRAQVRDDQRLRSRGREREFYLATRCFRIPRLCRG